MLSGLESRGLGESSYREGCRYPNVIEMTTLATLGALS